MTVIVYRDGIMAADTGTWVGEVVVSKRAVKIHRTPDGALYGCAGMRPDIERFKKWAAEGFVAMNRPTATENFGAIVVRPGGEIWKYDWKFHAYPVETDFATEGGAEEFMLGALFAGATAQEAVQLAIDHHGHAAGEVYWLALEQKGSGEAARTLGTIAASRGLGDAGKTT